MHVMPLLQQEGADCKVTAGGQRRKAPKSATSAKSKFLDVVKNNMKNELAQNPYFTHLFARVMETDHREGSSSLGGTPVTNAKMWANRGTRSGAIRNG